MGIFCATSSVAPSRCASSARVSRLTGFRPVGQTSTHQPQAKQAVGCSGAGLSRTDTLSVQVDDDGAGGGNGTGNGTGPRPGGLGLGLIGMRERVTALGGRLHAGHRDGGGFQVTAEVPIEGGAS